MATILGGSGADTLDFNSTVQYATVLGGEGVSTFDFASTVDDSTIRGGSGADTLGVTGVASNAVFAGGGGADEFTFSAATGTSVYAGAGNDSVIFSGVGAVGVNNTYYFGASDGDDTLSFSTLTAGTGLTIAVDAAYGATSGYEWSAGAFTAATATQGRITFGSGSDGTGKLFLAGVTGTDATGGAGKGLTYISFVTVSTATITELG